jgi:hypothetical protein
MAGDDAEAVDGAGQDDEAAPEGVHVRANGLVADGLVADDPVDAPQPQSSARARVSMGRRIFFLLERGAGRMITNLDGRLAGPACHWTFDAAQERLVAAVECLA